MSPGSQPRSQVIKASYDQSVLLTDWWLIEVESNSQERRLGVAGFRCNGTQAIRHFKSAAIVKRHDAVTLQAEDGITIVITNGINIFRSLENGFPCEVCSRFLSGFPYCWKDFAYKCTVKEYIDNISRSSTFGVSSTATFPDNLPVAHVRDALMLSYGDSARCLLEELISNYIPRKQGDNAFKNDTSKHTRQEDEINEYSRTANGDLPDNVAPKDTQNATIVEKKRKYKDHKLPPNPRVEENVCRKETSCGLSIGENLIRRTTRSMSRLNK